MAQAAVAGQVHQALDGHADLAAEVAFDHVLADFGAQALDFRLGPVADLDRRVDARSFATLLRTGTADAVAALQPDPDMPLDRKIVAQRKSVSFRIDLGGLRIIKKKRDYDYNLIMSHHN